MDAKYRQTEGGVLFPTNPLLEQEIGNLKTAKARRELLEKQRNCKHENYEFPDPRRPNLVRCPDCGIATIVQAHLMPSRKANTPGRNQPCPCGSGKKFKKCCINGEVKQSA